MATATVTGTLADLGLASIVSLNPQISFELSGATTTTDGYLLATPPVIVTPALDGTWAVTLVTSDTLPNGVYIRIAVVWLSAADEFAGKDYLPYKLTVPAGGGVIGDLLDTPVSPLQLWVDEDGSGDIPDGAKVGDYIYDPTTGDLYVLAA